MWADFGFNTKGVLFDNNLLMAANLQRLTYEQAGAEWITFEVEK